MLQINQLVGFGAGPRLSVVSLVDQAYGEGGVDLPDPIPAGALIFNWEEAANSIIDPAPPTIAAPSGFALAGSEQFGKTSFAWSYKTALGNEGGTTLSPGMTGSVLSQQWAFIIIPDNPVLSVAAFDFQSEFTDGNPTPTTLACAGAPAPVIAFANYFSSGTISPRGMTPTKTGEFEFFAGNWMAWKIFNVGETVTDVVIDMDDEGDDNGLQGLYITLS